MAKRGEKRNSAAQRSSKKARRFLIALIIFTGVAAVAVAVFVVSGRQGVPGSPEQVTGIDFQALKGRWLRADGGYVLEIRDISPDGRMDAGYFNPRQINVSRGEVSRRGQVTSVFIALRDTGYPGCTYTLLYDPLEDLLKGTYYQAAVQESYEIVLVRMK
jgi:hypothetical protein